MKIQCNFNNQRHMLWLIHVLKTDTYIFSILLIVRNSNKRNIFIFPMFIFEYSSSCEFENKKEFKHSILNVGCKQQCCFFKTLSTEYSIFRKTYSYDDLSWHSVTHLYDHNVTFGKYTFNIVWFGIIWKMNCHFFCICSRTIKTFIRAQNC